MVRLPSLRLCVMLLVGVAAIGLSAQTPPPAAAPPPQTPAPQTPVFRAGIDLIQVDVSVLDKDRKPVHGLTAADFIVREDERPQQVEAFAEVNLPDAVEPPAKWMKRASPDVTTNDLHDSRIVVIVLDDAVIPQEPAMASAAKSIGRDIVNKLGATDLASIIYTAANRQKTQDFTSDHGKLLAAVEKFTPGFATYGVDGDDYLFYQYSVNVVHDVADYLIALPNRRKTLIYVSTGVPVDPEALAPLLASGGSSGVAAREEMVRLNDDLREVFKRAQRANVNIYPIDPGGLGGVFNFVQRRMLQKGAPAPAADAAAHKAEKLSLDFLLEHADNTGGRATVNTNDYTEGIAQVFRENGSYYLLGYRQTNPKGPGSYSRLDVKVNRPGLDVRARHTNYTPKPDAALAKATAVTRALAGLLPSPETPMRVTVAPFARVLDPAATDKERKAAVGDVTVAIVLGVDEPAPRERVVEHVDLLTRAFSVEGDPKGAENQTADVTIKPGTFVPGMPPPFTRYEVLTYITLKPGRYQLRLAADNASQVKTGSVFVDVDVPDFVRTPLSLSGVVLESSTAPVSAPQDALKAVTPLVPTTDRDFPPGSEVRAFVRVYQGGRTVVAPAAMTVSILDEHDAKVFSSDTALPPDQFNANRAADFAFALPMDTLKPGAYLLVFEVKSDKWNARREVVFAVR